MTHHQVHDTAKQSIGNPQLRSPKVSRCIRQLPLVCKCLRTNLKCANACRGTIIWAAARRQLSPAPIQPRSKQGQALPGAQGPVSQQGSCHSSFSQEYSFISTCCFQPPLQLLRGPPQASSLLQRCGQCPLIPSLTLGSPHNSAIS